jgi:hypothetical protein
MAGFRGDATVERLSELPNDDRPARSAFPEWAKYRFPRFGQRIGQGAQRVRNVGPGGHDFACLRVSLLPEMGGPEVGMQTLPRPETAGFLLGIIYLHGLSPKATRIKGLEDCTPPPACFDLGRASGSETTINGKS